MKKKGSILPEKAGISSIARHALKKAVKTGKLISKVVKKVAETYTEEDATELIENPNIALDQALEFLPSPIIEVAREEMEREHKGREKIPEDVRRAVLQRDHHRCVVCGVPSPLELHHFKYVCQGGLNTTGNLVTLCSNHHRQIHYHGLKINKPRSVKITTKHQTFRKE